MKITKKLWEDNYEIALLSLNTKFVQNLKSKVYIAIKKPEIGLLIKEIKK